MFEYPDGRQDVGRDALLQSAQKALGTPTATSAVHITTNVWIEPSPEGARGGAYLLNIAPGERGKPATLTSVAFYEDTLVKTRDGWRLKRRKARSEGGVTPSLMTRPASN